MDYRIEHDSMGDMQVPADKYWGPRPSGPTRIFPLAWVRRLCPRRSSTPSVF